MKEFADKYQWVLFLIVLLIWIGGAHWEYSVHKRKQNLIANYFFVALVLMFGVSQFVPVWVEIILLVAVAATFWWISKKVSRQTETGQK